MGETYANIPLFVSQMKIVLPVVVLILVGLFAWGTYQDKKSRKAEETKQC